MTQKSPSMPIFDPTTLTYAKDVFQHFFGREVRRATRYRDLFSLLIIGPDPLPPQRKGLTKENTSRYEKIMTIIAENLKREFRETDFIGRVDTTFAIILLNAGNGDHLRVAQRVLARIAQYAFPPQVSPVRRRTLSIGAASFPHHGRNISTLMQKASTAFDIAQKEGGNRIHSLGFT